MRGRILTSYILRQLLVAFAFATGAVTFVVLFTQSFRLLSLVIESSSNALIFLELLFLSAFTFLPLIMPLGLGAAVLFIYNKLSSDSELIVMRAAGIGPIRLIEPALLLALIVFVASGALTLWVTPAANRQLVAMQYKMRDSYAVLLSKPGSFNDLAEGLTFYANKRGAGGALQGILIQDVRQPKKTITTMASTGKIVETGTKKEMIIFNGRRQEFDRATGKLSELAFDQYVLDLGALRQAASRRVPDPRELNLADLRNPSAEMLRARGPLSRFRGELHSRLAIPFLSLSYTLIALAAVLGGAFNRRGIARRLTVAGLAIIVAEAVFMSLNGLVAKDSDLIFLLYTAALLPIPLCLAFIIRDHVPLRLRRRLFGRASS